MICDNGFFGVFNSFAEGDRNVLVPQNTLYMRGGVLLLGLLVLLEPLFILEARRAESEGQGGEKQADSVKVPPTEEDGIPKPRVDRAPKLTFTGPQTAVLEDDTLRASDWSRIRRLVGKQDSLHLVLTQAQKFYLGISRTIKQTGASALVQVDTVRTE